MRVPVSWLADYVDLPEAVTAEHLHEALVRVGFEEEAVHGGAVTGPIVVGRVLERTPEPQKNGKTINWCSVDTGEAEPRGIVCGAQNFEVGDLVVATLPGAVLPGPFPIAARKTYGHVSDGMLASAKELGLGDDHDGIIVLGTMGIDAEPGTDALPLLGLDDYAVEINVTPDRGYAFSMRGVAREYAHSTGAAFRDPALDTSLRDDTAVTATFPVTIDDAAPIRGRVGASVFETRVVRGIDPTTPTPAWMRSRLRLAGIRSISIAVDVTNYVMWELGQPIHGYDLATLDGGITVRRATAGETFETLDGVTRKLDVEDLLITDDSGPIGLAGVMGGQRTEMSAATTDVLVEAANFDPVSIARTARRHKLPSEASKRFERGVDPDVAAVAAARVVHLLTTLAGGTADGLGSSFDTTSRPAPIAFPLTATEALTGIALDEGEAERLLRELGATVVDDGGALTVTPPSWRPDLTDRSTLVEEVARLAGYDRIPSVLPTAPPGRGLTREQVLRRAVANTLAAAGSTEVLTLPFVSVAQQRVFDDGPSVRLANAIDSEIALLRRSLLSGLVDAAHRNRSRGLTDLSLFEIGTVVRPAADAALGTDDLPLGGVRPDAATLASLYAAVPFQPLHVAGLVVGDVVAKQPGRAAQPAGVADAIDRVLQVGAAVGLALEVRQGAHPALHPGRTAEVLAHGVVVGVAGELLPTVAADLDLPRTVAVFELDLDAVIAAAPVDLAGRPLSTYPAATQDVSLVVPVATAAAEVHAALVAGAGALLEHVALVDDYRGAGMEPGTKSLTFALRFRATDRTLTAAEATEAKLAGVAVAAERLGARIRD